MNWVEKHPIESAIITTIITALVGALVYWKLNHHTLDSYYLIWLVGVLFVFLGLAYLSSKSLKGGNEK